MSTRLPPLAALRAFEAAARHGGFLAGAAELGVTPGAVSHQVKQLEAWLGQTLFDRQAAGVRLTATGRVFAGRLSGLFDQIAAAGRAARAGGRANVVLRCQFSLAAKWLAPRLGDFARRHRDIDLHLQAGPYDADPRRDGVDLSIYYSRGPLPGMRQDRLIAGRVLAAAAPDLIDALAAPVRPEDLPHLPLLHTRPAARGWKEPDWSTWLDAAGVPHDAAALAGPSFNFQHLTQEACISGAGVALLTDIFAAERLDRGDLVQVCDLTLPSPHAYFVITPEANLQRPDVGLVRDWLVSQADV